MIVVTGGAGFIGSAFAWKLNREGIDDILIVDDLDETDKWKNLRSISYTDYLEKDLFLELLSEGAYEDSIEAIIHMGACSSTTERDSAYLMENNYRYSQILAEWAIDKETRFIYASSAATYGDGAEGFSDDDEFTRKLLPQNMYGYSKHLFDLWALKSGAAKEIAGLKFFNVFGPNEYHKGDMSSVVFKAFHQIRETGKLQLFRSHKPDYEDGKQLRDFVYIKDCVDAMWWLLNNKDVNGVFNLGTGQARSWLDLAHATFDAMDREPQIEFIDMPESIRDRYQYFTQAEMEKLRNTGLPIQFRSLEESVTDYVVNHLSRPNPHLELISP